MANLIDVAMACSVSEDVILNRTVLVVNAKKISRLLKVIGKFFYEQILDAKTIYFNFSEDMTNEELEDAKQSCLDINPLAEIVTEPIKSITVETFSEIESKREAFRYQEKPVKIKRLLRTNERVLNVRNENPFNNNGISAWCYKFKKEFDERDVFDLLKILYCKNSKDIWRVKGYLKMSNGKKKKIDYTFGEHFLEDVEDLDVEKSNMLIVIGKNLNIHWLQEKFEGIDK